jgi:hypothetical protein
LAIRMIADAVAARRFTLLTAVSGERLAGLAL